MTDVAAVSAWIDGYRRAWESNDAPDIVLLFTESAVYRTEPYADPWIGQDAIVAEWLFAADEPGETTFHWMPVTIADDVAVIEATTVYRDGPSYRNLWVIRLAEDGRASEFTEWWMEEPDSAA
ncbi:MAG: nuclear transport factor 2 family protein [Cryobacterium sp.]